MVVPPDVKKTSLLGTKIVIKVCLDETSQSTTTILYRERTCDEVSHERTSTKNTVSEWQSILYKTDAERRRDMGQLLVAFGLPRHHWCGWILVDKTEQRKETQVRLSTVR
jgi:hypothetical protein